MEGLIMTAQIILALSILVSLHELGHFLAARMFGIKVEKFYVFFDAFGYKLMSYKKGDTEYGIGWLPLGGYVKIAGMIDESMDKSYQKEEPKDWEFRSKPAWQRLIVMAAGVFVNVLLGIFIFAMLTFYYGKEYLPAENIKHGIVAHQLAQDIGLETGDKLIAVNNNPIERFDDVSTAILALESDMQITVDRDGEIIDITVPDNFFEMMSEAEGGFIEPRFKHYVAEIAAGSYAQEAGLQVNDRIVAVNGEETIYFDQLRKVLIAIAEEKEEQEVKLEVLRDDTRLEINAKVGEDGILGFMPGSDLEFARIDYGFFASFPEGTKQAFEMLMVNIKGFGKVITGQVAADKALAGPIGIAQIFGGTWDWQKFWFLTGLLSMVLAFVNFLPIPALDGGHAMFLLIEIVRGKPLPDKFIEVAQVAGFVILIMLMIFVFYVDIAKL